MKYINKIGEFNYIDIKDLVNNIRNNAINEIDAKKDLNALDEIKNVEIIKYKKRTPGHKKLLNLVNDLLDTILTDKTLESESQEKKNESENEKVENRKEENEKIESKKEENEYEGYENENEWENENEDDYENEDKDDAETVDQNEKNIIIEEKEWSFRWNDWQIKIIWRPNRIIRKSIKSRRVLFY